MKMVFPSVPPFISHHKNNNKCYQGVSLSRKTVISYHRELIQMTLPRWFSYFDYGHVKATLYTSLFASGVHAIHQVSLRSHSTTLFSRFYRLPSQLILRKKIQGISLVFQQTIWLQPPKRSWESSRIIADLQSIEISSLVENGFSEWTLWHRTFPKLSP